MIFYPPPFDKVYAPLRSNPGSAIGLVFIIVLTLIHGTVINHAPIGYVDAEENMKES